MPLFPNGLKSLRDMLRSAATAGPVRPGLGFVGYRESASPQKHNPWQSFTTTPSGVDQLFSAFPTDYRQLPAVSFVVPDLTHDMHDGTIAAGDAWLQSNLDPTIQSCKTGNGVFILVWDEDDYATGDSANNNRIPFLVVGQGVTAGSTDGATFNHYSTLAYIQNCFGLPLLGNAQTATPIAPGNAAPSKIVVCIMENHSFSNIIGDTTDAPYINSLVSQGKLYTQMYGVTHPSEPNYFALFAGTTEGVTDDGTYTETDQSLASQLGAWTPPVTTPAAPSLTIVPSSGSNAVSFTDGFNGGSAVTSRKLYRSTTSGFTPGAGNLIATLNSSTSSFTDSGLTNGTSYYYVGTEVNAIGEGVASNQKTGVPAAASGGYTFTNPEAQAYVARMTTQPTSARMQLIDNLFTTLKSDGTTTNGVSNNDSTYVRLDWMHLYASASQQAALLDIKGHYDGVIHGAPTFTADRGFAGGGVVANYILTPYDMSTGTSATKGASLNNESLGVWTNDTLGAPANIIGSGASALNAYIRRTSATGVHSRGFSTSSGDPVLARSDQLVVMTRANASTVNYYSNNGAAVPITAASSAATAGLGVPTLSDANQSGDGGTSSSSQVAADFAGQNLSAANVATLYSAIHTYLIGTGDAT